LLDDKELIVDKVVLINKDPYFNFLSLYLFLDLSLSLFFLSFSLSTLSQIFFKRWDASKKCRPVEKEKAKEDG
jgi:hypothetical protein